MLGTIAASQAEAEHRPANDAAFWASASGTGPSLSFGTHILLLELAKGQCAILMLSYHTMCGIMGIPCVGSWALLPGLELSPHHISGAVSALLADIKATNSFRFVQKDCMGLAAALAFRCTTQNVVMSLTHPFCSSFTCWCYVYSPLCAAEPARMLAFLQATNVRQSRTCCTSFEGMSTAKAGSEWQLSAMVFFHFWT